MASCELIIDRYLAEMPEVTYVQIDPARKTLSFETEGDVSADTERRLAELRGDLDSNLRYCPFDSRDDLANYCISCRHITKASHVDLGARSLARKGMIRVQRSLDVRVDPLRRTTLPIHEEGPRPEGKPGAERGGASVVRRLRSLSERLFTVERLEAFFVAITFAAMVTGRVLERNAVPGRWIVWLVAYLTGGYFGLTSGIEKIRERKIDVDLLMILAALGAAAVGAPFEGVLLLFLFSLSNVLQDFALDRTRSAIESLVKLRPTTAEVLRDGMWMEVPVEAVGVGERFRVRPGGRAPLDGVVEAGTSAMDEAILTGESRPVEKQPGSEVLSGAINGSGSLEVTVATAAADSTIARIVRMVEQARENKARTEHMLDRFEQWYTVVVLAGTAAAVAIPTLLLGEAWSPAFYRAMTIMVAASPCALVISTPASVLSAIGNGARRGILFKGGVYVEQAARIRAVAFDKTGTLTYGALSVSDIVPAAGETESSILAAAAALEEHSEHAIARAVVASANERGVDIPAIEHFDSLAGRGIVGQVEGRRLRIGTPAFIREIGPHDPSEILGCAEELADEGRTIVTIAEECDDGATVLGVFGLRDTLRPDAERAIRRLRSAGVEHVIMLTGDNIQTARRVAREASVDDVRAELLPDEKLRTIEDLQESYGHLAMVGDGVNDAPALARSDIGIAMGARGTDVAMETADIVLMGDDLCNIPYVLSLSRATRRTLIFNLGLALGLIVVMLVGIFWIALPLPLAVVGHEGGTVLVSLNGLRLLLFRDRGNRGEDVP